MTGPSSGAGAAPGSAGWIGSAGPQHITVAGRDLVADLMGRLSLTELAYLLLTGREPSPAQTRMLDAVLVALADHGLTPSVLAARLTHAGAPEAPQAAVAAGLLGAGSVLLGPAGDTAVFLARALAGRAGDGPAALREVAEAAVAERRAAGQRVPGLGHPVHRQQDPRTPRLYQLARDEGLLGLHLGLLEAVATAHQTATGRLLPVNGAGAGGAALADAGIPPASVRGFVLIGRTAGLVAHLADEASNPLAPTLWPPGRDP